VIDITYVFNQGRAGVWRGANHDIWE